MKTQFSSESTHRGTKPITKNINVVDQFGNQLEATYTKRAKGLVKHGRARFIDENTICLACPPKTQLEDIMSTDKNTTPNVAEEVQVQPQITPNAETERWELDVQWVMERINMILYDKEHIMAAINGVANIDETQSDTTKESQISTFGFIVRTREDTNREMLKFLEKVYDDLKPKAVPDKFDKFHRIFGASLPFMQSDTLNEIIKESMKDFNESMKDFKL